MMLWCGVCVMRCVVLCVKFLIQVTQYFFLTIMPSFALPPVTLVPLSVLLCSSSFLLLSPPSSSFLTFFLT